MVKMIIATPVYPEIFIHRTDVVINPAKRKRSMCRGLTTRQPAADKKRPIAKAEWPIDK